jgi:hypothetical protein
MVGKTSRARASHIVTVSIVDTRGMIAWFGEMRPSGSLQELDSGPAREPDTICRWNRWQRSARTQAFGDAIAGHGVFLITNHQ